MTPEQKQRRREDNKRYRDPHRARINEANRKYMRQYYRDNKEKYIAASVARRCAKYQASLLRLEGERKAITMLYAEARKKTEETGVPYVVDHIWPLNGKRSCGLHVSWNMQVITSAENDSKGNKEPES